MKNALLSTSHQMFWHGCAVFGRCYVRRGGTSNAAIQFCYTSHLQREHQLKKQILVLLHGASRLPSELESLWQTRRADCGGSSSASPVCEAERQRPASNSWQSRRKIKDAANTIGLRATRRCLRNEKVILAAFTAVFTVLVWAFWKRCYLYLLVLFDGCWREGTGGDTKEERECND